MADPVDELYMLAPGEFTAARDRLAAQLVAAKHRDRAREVKALRRPTVAAWVVNQLAHRHAPAVRRLIEAGDVLRRAQRRVLRGASADELRTAAKDRQEALRDLRRLVAPILRDAGSAAHLDDVLATLEAASVDPEAAKVVTAGRLSRELSRPAGFGDTLPLSLVPSRKAAPQTRPTPEPKPVRGDLAAKRRRARERAAEATRLEREAARGAQAVQRASRRTATFERARRAEERRVQQLRRQLDAAERRLRDAEADLSRAQTEESRASEHADALRRSADAARADVETD